MDQHHWMFERHVSALQKQRRVSDEELLQRVDWLMDRIFDGLETGKMDYISMILESEDQHCESVFSLDSLQYEVVQESEEKEKKVKVNRNLKQFCRYLQVISVVVESVKSGHYKSKREMYYENPELFENQGYLNQIVKKLAFTLQVPRRQLHIVSATKGLVSGPLVLRNFRDELELDIGCLSQQKKGFNITEFMDYWDQLEVTGKCILVVEKETVYFRLLDEQNQHFLSHFVIVTGKGYPCHATQQFVKLLSILNSHIPVYYLGDMDPHGFDILCLYTFGNASLTFEQANIPWINWLNLHLQFTNQKKGIPLNDRERVLLQNLVNRPYFQEKSIQQWQQWKQRMSQLLETNTKYELESICENQQLSDLILRHF